MTVKMRLNQILERRILDIQICVYVCFELNTSRSVVHIADIPAACPSFADDGALVYMVTKVHTPKITYRKESTDHTKPLMKKYVCKICKMIHFM